ncbi:hypothetical protein EVAR_102642_1 [Eumeta japonica]|uniref:Uncharacterized protein n=1 Tax=Eumeta variegata TaxID=151549 RepID=A0A4C1TUR9_EUMVA|nr:hypothetical protein EVAR_102642_1 [Eumeta japonica]
MLKIPLELSLTTDVCSKPSASVSLLSLTAHGIIKDFIGIKIILICSSLQGRHTSDINYDNFKMMLREWNIQDEQLHCFVRYDGSDMVRAMRLADIPDVSCTHYVFVLRLKPLK